VRAKCAVFSVTADGTHSKSRDFMGHAKTEYAEMSVDEAR
jgi:hypothetical protein